MTKQVPWLRVLVEGAAIVVSILLAFALQAWWEVQTELQEEQQILSAVYVEFQANLRTIADQVARVSDIEAATLAVMAEGASLEPMASVDSLDQLIGRASWWSQSEFEMAAIDAVTIGGQLSLIRSGDLRRMITTWQRDVVTFERLVAQDYDFFFGAWMPFLNEMAYVPQIANAIKTVPGSGEANFTGQVPVWPTKSDHRPLVRDRQFQGLLLQKVWIQDDILHTYETLESSLQDMLDVLSSEMAGQAATQDQL